MATVLEQLKQSLIDYGNTLKQRAEHPLDTLNNALQNLGKAPPDEVAMSLIGGGVGHIASESFLKMFPEFAQTVLHKEGKLIPLYHGTSKDADFKNLKQSPRGTWLTTDAESASKYAVDNDARGLKYNPDTGKYNEVNTASRVIPVYANVQKMYIPTEEEFATMRMTENYVKYQKELMAKAVASGHDAIDYGGGVIAVSSPNQLKSTLSPK